MELEAGSRSSHWEREVYETGWLVAKAGTMRDTLEMPLLFPATGSHGSGLLWKMTPKSVGDASLCPTSQILSIYSRGSHVFHLRFCSPSVPCPLSPRNPMLKDLSLH